MIRCRLSYELSMQIHSGVVTFSGGNVRIRESWYWRFLLMVTLVHKLTWTGKFKESELSTI
jgi:hypothetical protein